MSSLYYAELYDGLASYVQGYVQCVAECAFLFSVGLLKQAIAAVGAAIQNAECAGIAIDISEEVMTQKIDLNKCFLFC